MFGYAWNFKWSQTCWCNQRHLGWSVTSEHKSTVAPINMQFVVHSQVLTKLSTCKRNWCCNWSLLVVTGSNKYTKFILLKLISSLCWVHLKLQIYLWLVRVAKLEKYMVLQDTVLVPCSFKHNEALLCKLKDNYLVWIINSAGEAFFFFFFTICEANKKQYSHILHSCKNKFSQCCKI